MKTVAEIKLTLDYLYGFNIMTRSRKRKYAYARKSFAVLASNYGHTNESITASYKALTHDVIIYSHKTMNNINKIDMIHYNRCIDRLNLRLKKIPSLNSLQDNPVADDIHELLKTLGRKDLAYFKTKVFEPFMDKLEFEKSINQM